MRRQKDSYHENDQNYLPDSFNFDPFVVRRNRVDVVFVVIGHDVDDAVEWRRNAERDRKRDDDKREGEEEDGVAHVTLESNYYNHIN